MSAFGHKSYTVEEATRRLEQYCAYQERCHQEVVQKLRQMRMIPQAIDAIVVHLIENGFLNEARFARAFAGGKFRQKNWGRQRITSELKARGIGAYLIRQALAEIPEAAYLEALDRLVEKKKGEWEGNPPGAIAQKLYRYLAYRGWENELIQDRIGPLFDRG